MTAKDKNERPKKRSVSEAADKKHLAKLEESYQRVSAEYANFRRRSDEEKAVLAAHVKAELLEKLFPIMDNLERASQHAPTIPLDDFTALTEDDFRRIANYFSGLRQIEKQLETTLQNAGLKRIATTGEVFNHHLHEAISYEPSSQVPADHIIGEVESGWQINGKVVRPAKVRVSQG